MKKIAVIGAGCSGLAAINCCLEDGLLPTCFEREDAIGGLWNYTEEPRPGKGSVYKSCVINTSKEMTAFSNFPVPKHYPPFMPHDKVLEYVRLYAVHFGLLKYVRFSTSVENILPANDHDDTGRWNVVSRKSDDTQSGAVTVETYDGVMVCTGHHVFPYVPHIPGLSEFRGTKLHSHEYRRPEPFEGKKVVIIGIGNSAVDIAVDLSRTASQVFLSTRRGAWIVSRMGPLGFPADALANSRFMFTLPQSWLQWMVELIANYRFDHDNYGLKARHGALEAHPTINDDLPHRILVGAVQARSHVVNVGTNFVEFDDGTKEEVDAIILATGYDYQYKFLDDSILNIQENRVDLYEFVFPPKRKHATLAVIGLVQAIGAVIPISEMQARWYTSVMTGRCRLPDSAEMMAKIAAKRASMTKQYLPSRRHHLQTFWISYMDTIAEKIGARPSMLSLLRLDVWFALRCYFGPCIPAQYRLTGPNKWEGAKDAICRSLMNNIHGTKTRTLTASVKDNGMPPKQIKTAVAVTFVVMLMLVLFWFALLTV